MTKVPIIFRVDGDFKIGLGHKVRSLTLAKSLREDGFEIGFLTKSLLVKEAADKEDYPSWSIKDKFDWPEGLKADLVITDINHTSLDYMKRLKKTGTKLVTFDDLGEGRDLADLIVDATLSPSPDPKCFYGPDYIVLRQEFSPYAQKERVIKKEVRQILVSMGGSDPSNLTLKVVEALRELDIPILANIIIGKAFGQKERLLKSIEGGEKFRIEEDVTDIPEKMFRADLAIVSAGVTMFELACLGTPGVIMAQDEVQAKNLTPFKEQDLFIDLGLWPTINKIKESVRRLSLDYRARLKMSSSLREFVDGQGLFRVTKAIKNLSQKRRKTMFRKISLIALFFLLLGDYSLKAEIVEKILAKVNNQIITLLDLKEKLAENPSIGQVPFDQIPEEIKMQVLNLMIEERLILKEAKEKKIAVSDEEVEAAIENVRKRAGGQEKFAAALTLSGITIEELKEKYKEELTKQKVIEKEIVQGIKVDPVRLKEDYEKAKAQIRVCHILVKTEEEAKDVLLKLKSGDDFDSLAQRVSICPSAQKGGDLGFFGQGQMVKEFEEAAFLLSDTQPLSGIVKTQFGYHIIKFKERKELSKEEMAERIEMIEEQIRREEFLKKYKEWMDGLKGKAYIKISQ